MPNDEQPRKLAQDYQYNSVKRLQCTGAAAHALAVMMTNGSHRTAALPTGHATQHVGSPVTLAVLLPLGATSAALGLCIYVFSRRRLDLIGLRY
jgi:hypothetical protein